MTGAMTRCRCERKQRNKSLFVGTCRKVGEDHRREHNFPLDRVFVCICVKHTHTHICVNGDCTTTLLRSSSDPHHNLVRTLCKYCQRILNLPPIYRRFYLRRSCTKLAAAFASMSLRTRCKFAPCVYLFLHACVDA